MTAQRTGEAAPLALTEEQQDVVRAEIEALLPALSHERGKAYQALAEAVAEGEVPSGLVGPLEELLSLALETGRARSVYSAEGERVLTDLFLDTPRGREMSRNLADINRALGVLQGHELSGARVAMRTLGHFTVRIATRGAGVTLSVRPGSVSVESVSFGEESGGPS